MLWRTNPTYWYLAAQVYSQYEAEITKAAESDTVNRPHVDVTMFILSWLPWDAVVGKADGEGTARGDEDILHNVVMQ